MARDELTVEEALAHADPLQNVWTAALRMAVAREKFREACRAAVDAGCSHREVMAVLERVS